MDENGDEKLVRENYAKLLSLWVNQDTGPFVKAIQIMQKFYFERAIDLFKIAIYVPGIARSWLYKEAKQHNAYFSLIAEEDDDLHHTLKQNLVGGYSGIFTRKHVVDETRLRHADGEICQSIVGYDANSLYLRCIGQDMPCGGYVRRLAPHFTPSTHFKCKLMFEWMNYISSAENIRILHARNHREVGIGGHLLEGIHPETNTIFNTTVANGIGVLSKKMRRLLVRGMRDDRLLLTSDFLRWYLSEGLVIDKLFQVVEYTPVRCFT